MSRAASARVVVSGLGVVSPYGAGVKSLWTGLSAGACAIRPVTAIETEGFRSRVAAEVPGEVLDGLRPSRRRSRADRIALAAGAEAMADAALDKSDRRRAACLVGAVGGGMYEAEAWYWDEARGGRSRAGRRALRSILPRAHADALAFRFGLEGPRETLVMACASGAASIALGADLIRDGVVDVALVGGVDALTRICFMGFNALKLLAPEPCRPFDRDRRGMSIGEGAAFLVLEEAGHCRARGGRAHAELAGAAMTTDAHHVTAPHPDGEGMIRAMSLALGSARMASSEIGYVNAHGTGTPQNDRIEALALTRVFGEGRVLVSSSKSLVGHTMAASGSVEAVATILAIEHSLVPPTANLSEVDPAVPFDCVPVTARPVPLEAALSNSFGFGGQNVSLIFRRFADRVGGPGMAPHTPQRSEAPRLSRDAPRPRESLTDSDMPGSSAPAQPRERRRVVITGMGTVNALTSGGRSAVAEALALGRSGIGSLRAFVPEPGGSGLAAEVDDARLAALVDPGEARRLSRICRLAVAACRLAVEDAGVGSGPGLAIVVGSEHGDFRSSEEFAGGYLQRGPAGLSPMIFPNTVMNTMASVAAIAVGARAPSVTLNQPTIVGDLAVARAAAIVARGDAEASVAGGVDEICALVYRHLQGLGALSPMRGGGPEGCRPYAADHNGPVLGEGATFVVLESLDAARARGASIVAEVVDQAWGNVPAPAHAARPGRADRGSPVNRLLAAHARAGFRRVYGAGNGDAGVDDWECGLLAKDLGRRDAPPLSLAPLFGQHGGLGALRVGAAALDAARGLSPALVHGIARGGCRTALIIATVVEHGARDRE